MPNRAATNLMIPVGKGAGGAAVQFQQQPLQRHQRQGEKDEARDDAAGAKPCDQHLALRNGAFLRKHHDLGLPPLWYAVKFQPVIDQFKAQLFGHPALQLFDILVAEFDHAARGHVDQVVVMGFRHFLIARAAVAEIMPLQDAGILEQLDGAVDGGDGNMRVDGGGTAVQFLGIGMVGGIRQHPGDHPALVRHPKTLVDAGFFNPRHRTLLWFAGKASGYAILADSGSLRTSASVPL